MQERVDLTESLLADIGVDITEKEPPEVVDPAAGEITQSVLSRPLEADLAEVPPSPNTKERIERSHQTSRCAFTPRSHRRVRSQPRTNPPRFS